MNDQEKKKMSLGMLDNALTKYAAKKAWKELHPEAILPYAIKLVVSTLIVVATLRIVGGV